MKYNLGDKVKCNGFLKKTGYYILIEKDKYNQAVYTNDPQYSVDKDKYSEVMITDESGKHCLFHYEFKDYTPYFEKYGKVRGRKYVK